MLLTSLLRVLLDWSQAPHITFRSVTVDYFLSIYRPVLWFVPLTALLSVPVSDVVSRAAEDTVLPPMITFSWEAFGQLALPLGAGICAACVAAFRNPMHSLLALLAVFFCTAVLYLIAGLSFVGVVFLIIYVGAVAVLFLFVIMLLNVKSLTSNDALIQHWTQLLAIVFATALLAQLSFTLGGAFDHLLALSFLRDAVLEFTTSEAVSFYVRYQAMDINRLTGLYTVHGILLLLITAVLLVALLGAIILATVTTERAISISDLHQYPKKVSFCTVFASCTVLFLALLPQVGTFDCVTFDDFDPILFSAYAREARRDIDLRTHRKLKQDVYVIESCRFLTEPDKYKPFRKKLVANNVSIDLLAPARARVVFKTAKQQWKLGVMRCGQWSRIRRLVRTEEGQAKFAGYFSKLALAPLFARRYRRTRKVLIMRRRWLWRWRRNRAVSLRRIVVRRKRLWSKLGAAKKVVKRYLDGDSLRNAIRGIDFKEHYYKRVVLRIRPALRLLGKRRMPFFKFLHLMFITKVCSRLFYWAWRLRAFCCIFICFLFVVPPLLTIIWFILEERDAAWASLYEIYPKTIKALQEYTDLGSIDIAYSRFLAVLLYLPALIFSVIYQSAPFYILIALFFAWDFVTSHGGELSDAEFHESRCNYWRKRADDYRKSTLFVEERIDRERPWLKNHPDKGRIDIHWAFFKAFSQLPPPFHLMALLGAVVDIILAIKALLVGAVFNFLSLLLKGGECIARTEGARALVRAVKYTSKGIAAAWSSIREAANSFAQLVIETFPFLIEWYAFAVALLAKIVAFGEFLCSYISWGFYRIEYTPEFLPKILKLFPFEQYYIVVVSSIVAAAAVYFASVFTLLLLWKRLYSKNIRRPPIYPYLLAFAISLYILSVLGQHVKLNSLTLAVEQIPTPLLQDIYKNILEGWDHFVGWFRTAYYFIYLYTLYLAFTLVRSIVQRAYARKYAYSRPVVFRAYYNYYLRRVYGHFDVLFREELANELASSPSIDVAYNKAVARGRKQVASAEAAQKAEANRFILIRLVYVPSFYDPHPVKKYRKDPWAFAYVVENHYENPHHSI